MASHHNLGTVIWFEFTRTVKKPSFWAATLSLPILIAAIFAIAFYSQKSSIDSQANLAEEKFSMQYLDESKIISPEIAGGFKAKKSTNKSTAITAVKDGDLDAFFYYPKDLTKNPVEIYAKDDGLFNNGKYDAVAKQMLNLSTSQSIGDPQLIAVAQGNIQSTTTAYKDDGTESAGWWAAAPPLIFLVLFYFAVTMLGNNLLNSTVEEKENRVTEMILTALNPTDLIVGKLIATFMAGILQAIILLIPVVAAYLFLGSDGAGAANLPDLTIIDKLVLDPATMAIGFLLFIGGMILFTGTLVAVGAIMPTAKEAGQWFGIGILMMLIPFYIMQLILSDPQQIVVSVFTYFPFTAPVTAMLRNAFGSLSLVESATVIAILFILGSFIIQLAVKLFRYGAMEYSDRLSLKRIFK